jgi:hypothetical protein
MSVSLNGAQLPEMHVPAKSVGVGVRHDAGGVHVVVRGSTVIKVEVGTVLV